MKVLVDKSFEKDISKLKNKTLHKKVAQVIEQVMDAKKKGEIHKLKKIQGSHPRLLNY